MAPVQQASAADMTTPTQAQPYQGSQYSNSASQSGSSAVAQSTYPQERQQLQSAQGQYPPAPAAGSQFDKYCIIHIATTCDEHGVYVTKDSAEVIELGWTVVDARDPSLPEVSLAVKCSRFHH